MKIGICDDTAQDRTYIENICRDLGYTDIYLYSSGEELLQSPELSSLTLLFLDIKMSGMSGIEVKNQLELTVPSIMIVFCTNHKDSIEKAFGRNVIFFFTKPMVEREIKKVINKAALLSKRFYKLKIDDSHVILCQDVLYLKTEQKYTIFHTTDGKMISSREPLKKWLGILKDLGFCPVSRSAIINLNYYQKQEKQRVYLNDGSSVAVSRRCLQTLKEASELYKISVIGLYT